MHDEMFQGVVGDQGERSEFERWGIWVVAAAQVWLGQEKGMVCLVG